MLLGHAYEVIETGSRLLRCMSPVVADIVAKVENRTMPKISRRQIFRRLYRYNTP
jgi:hypothetical protein